MEPVLSGEWHSVMVEGDSLQLGEGEEPTCKTLDAFSRCVCSMFASSAVQGFSCQVGEGKPNQTSGEIGEIIC